MKRIFNNLIGFLVTGLITCLPVAIIFLIISWGSGLFSDTSEEIAELLLPEKFTNMESGFAIIVLMIVLIGILVKKTILGIWIGKIPAIGLFIGRSQGNTMNFQRLKNLEPCLFRSSPTTLAFGWILSREKTNLANEEELCNIFIPSTGTIFPGNNNFVPKKNIMLVGNTSAEIINLGPFYSSKSPKKIILLPWEDETEEAFLKRTENFELK